MKDHRKHVGPIKRWDLVRDNYTEYLKEQGLKPHHCLCDVGCGVMRNGLHLINYLNRGRYFGIDASKKAIDAGIANELTSELIEEKRPTFVVDDHFKVHALGKHMDWICSYAVFIHCGRDQLNEFLANIRRMVDANAQPTTLIIDIRIGEKDAEKAGEWKLYRRASHNFVAYRLSQFEEIVSDFAGRIVDRGSLSIDERLSRYQFRIEFEPV